jgi:GNAT superfamily N-acetyltransferase
MWSSGRPDKRWGYVGHMFVQHDCRNRGMGSRLLETVRRYRQRCGGCAAARPADGRGYVMRAEVRAEGLEPPRA